MTFPIVKIAIDSRGVAEVSLNRPDANNAYNGEMLSALLTAVQQAATERAVRIVLIRGMGRHFQAGADLNWLREISSQDAGRELAGITPDRRGNARAQ